MNYRYHLIGLLLFFYNFTQASDTWQFSHTGKKAEIGEMLEWTARDIYPGTSVPIVDSICRLSWLNHAEGILMVIESPTGVIYKIPGFYYEAVKIKSNANSYCERSGQFMEDRIDINTSENVWKIRFSPNISGQWNYRIFILRDQRFISYSDGNFECADVPAHVPIVHLHERYYQTDQGKSFIPLGQSYGWEYECRQQFCTIIETVQQLAMHGANTIRLMFNHEQGLCITGYNSVCKKFYYNTIDPLNAWIVDSIFQYCQHHGIYIQLCLFYTNSFNPRPDWPSEGWKSNWFRKDITYKLRGWNEKGIMYENVYIANRSVGIEYPPQFFDFSNFACLQLQKNLISYIASRWGSYPNLLNWEIFNEFNQLYDTSFCVRPVPTPEIVNLWMDSVQYWLHTMDPFQRTVTTSLAGDGLSDGKPDRQQGLYKFWKICDQIQAHIYTYDDFSTRKPAGILFQELAFKTVDAYFRYDRKKSFLLGEGGYYLHNNKLDPNGFEFHNALWSSLFTRSAGPLIYWDFGYVRNKNLYHLYQPIRRFIDSAGYNRSVRFTNGKYINDSLFSYGYIHNLIGGKKNNWDSCFIWLQDKNFRIDSLYIHHFPYLTYGHLNYRPPVSSGEIVIPIRKSKNTYQIHFYSTETGRRVEIDQVKYRIDKKKLVITIPGEVMTGRYGDVVLRIIKI